MKEIPILFSTPMVQAILDGRKTQTRRIVKPQPILGLSDDFNEPQREENHAAITQADMLGLSWGTRTKEFAGKTSGWKQGKQSPEKSEMGNASGELERQESAWDGKRGGEALEFEVYGRREEPHPLGDRKRVMQPETCSAGIGSVAIRNIQHCPCAPGMTLWVRETWKCVQYNSMDGNLGYKVEFKDGSQRYFEFDDNERFHKFGKFAFKSGWQSPYFMPREAARIFLRVTNVRVERLQEITAQDAKAEGMFEPYIASETGYETEMRGQFRDLWDSLNAKRGYGWDINPFVWVVEFRRVEK